MNILFYVAKKYSLPVISPLTDYLSGKTEHRFALYVSAKVARTLGPQWAGCTIIDDLRTAREFAPDCVLTPGNFVDFRIPGLKVQIFHGLGLEKASHFKIRHFFDVYCTSGPAVTGPFLEMQKKYGYFRVVETGWPKVDYILSYPTAGLRERFAIPPGAKVVLYAPTFSSGMQSAGELLPHVPKVIADNEIWLVKFHELMSKELVEQFRAANELRVRIVDDFDITPCLHAADILVSDTSSVVYEFLLLNKPVITFRTVARPDKGINIENPQELRGALDAGLSNPQEALKNRDRQIAEVNPRMDGTIAETVIANVEILVRDGLKVKRKKPLNLYRKLQVLHHGIFRKGYLR